jgi:2-methylcitrate dehydratase PrpD
MANETVRLAQYAAALRYEDIPAEIIGRAKECIADTVAAIICGAALPWSRIVIGYAERTGPGGTSRILGTNGLPVTAPAGALANGALAHAFELDSLTRPGAGVHPGATLVPPALAIAQQQDLGGRDLIAAFVAGCEVMVRIGRATGHTNEQRGFHAPGNTGPFGGAVAGGHLLRLDPERMANALGIAGSLASGLLEFARAGKGGMVKRLHLGRASEGGVLAASLAQDGFTAPDTVLEGPFGFLAVFCREWDVGELTKGLGEQWETTTIALKRYPCHINAHAAVKALSQLQAEHGFAGSEVESIAISGGERMTGLHNIPEPADLMMAQYSVPFCAALALYRDPRNPRIFCRRCARRP